MNRDEKRILADLVAIVFVGVIFICSAVLVLGFCAQAAKQ